VIPPGVTFPKNKCEGEIVSPSDGDGCWRWSYEKYKQEALQGNVEFKRSKQRVLLNDEGEPSEY
jgi:adenine-specific DNA-methyltransferase